MEVRTPTSTKAGAGGGEGGQHAGGGASPPGRQSGAGGGPKGDPVAGGLKDRNPTAWSEVSWKSINLARRGRENLAGKDKEGLSLLDSGETQNKQGTVGKSRVGKGADGSSGSGEGQKDTRRRSLQETESSTMRQHARKREEEFLAGGAQNFYKPVRVCGSCFRVSELDFSTTKRTRKPADRTKDSSRRDLRNHPYRRGCGVGYKTQVTYESRSMDDVISRTMTVVGIRLWP